MNHGPGIGEDLNVWVKNLVHQDPLRDMSEKPRTPMRGVSGFEGEDFHAARADGGLERDSPAELIKDLEDLSGRVIEDLKLERARRLISGDPADQLKAATRAFARIDLKLHESA